MSYKWKKFLKDKNYYQTNLLNLKYEICTDDSKYDFSKQKIEHKRKIHKHICSFGLSIKKYSKPLVCAHSFSFTMTDTACTQLSAIYAEKCYTLLNT